MKLFSLPDGTIDRFDRAQWLSIPFDGAFGAPVVVTEASRRITLIGNRNRRVQLIGNDNRRIVLKGN